jgi:hypothetical protein
MDDAPENANDTTDSDELELGMGQSAARWALSNLAAAAAHQMTQKGFDAAVRAVRARRS